ncbi:hypothetical protein [Streptacidiphilus sp. MAP5-3]|uniref:hypothetical protein n=1 Tax=unclassified Streptacidiphilus TaxID=2643834 RepID=UPI0035119271
MVTYDQLANLRLDTVDAVASSFEKMTRTWDLDSSYESDVIRPLTGAGWQGPAADAAAGTLTQTRTQIVDAFDEASSLARALRDLHDQLASAQKSLQQAVTDAQAQGLTVDDNGGVHWPPPSTPAERHDPGYASSYSEIASPIADRIAAAVKAASDADDEVASALAADTGSSTTSFNAKPVGGIAEEEAQQAAALAAQGNNLTDAQLAQLDALLKANANDPRFTTAFYQDLGPKESLLFYGQLAWGSAGNGAANDPGRVAVLKDLEAQLGTSLATATNTGNWPHLTDTWEAQLRQVGGQQLQLDTNDPNDPQGKVYGYQILSNYLRTGKYDEHFLLPVAQDITNMSEKNSSIWVNESLQGTNDRLNFLDSTAGYNPMTGVLLGLGRSPQASTDYFNTQGNLAYLTNPTDNNVMLFTDSTAPGPDAAKAAHADQINAMGDALQSATTGMAFDAPSGTPIPQHSPGMAEVATNVMNTFGGKPSLLSGDHGTAYFSQLNNSVSHITASYIGDVDHAMNPSVASAPAFGTAANVNGANAIQLLHALGRDPNAYGVVLQAQNAYTGAQIQSYVQQHPNDPHLDGEVRNLAQGGAFTNGILAQSRVQEIQQNSAASDAQYNAAISRNTGIANTVWSMTGGALVGKIPVVGGYVNSGVSDYINAVGSSYQVDNSAQAITQGTDAYHDASVATQNAASLAVTQWYKGPDGTEIAQSAGGGAQSGFSAGDGTGTTTQGQ